MTVQDTTTFKHNEEASSNKKKQFSKEVILNYKYKYPTTFMELKLDGYSDSDVIRHINKMNSDADNEIQTDCVRFMTTLSFQ